MQSLLLRLGLLIVVSLLLLPNISSSQDVSIIADGGILSFGVLETAGVRLVVSLENGMQVSRIRGSVSHPYGDGPFEVQIAAAEFVQSASITPFFDRVNFDVHLSNSIPDPLTELFAVIPGRAAEPFNIRYPQGVYPYPLQWHFCETYDRSGVPIQPRLATDPILYFSDIDDNLLIIPQRFPSEVKSITIVEINDAPLYYIVPSRKQITGEFIVDGIVWGTGSKSRLPLTFEVILVDGTKYTIRHPHFDDEIRLFPPSGAGSWELYQ